MRLPRTARGYLWSSTNCRRSFPGCYSVISDIKRAQHRGEARLAQCEALIERFSPSEATKSARLERLNHAWDDLLFTQFHDI